MTIPLRPLPLLVLLVTASLGISPLEAAELRAGAAQVDITPPTGFPMWGYAARHAEPSVGVRDRLQARALVLDAGAQRLALVSLDLGRAPTRTSFQAIQARLKKEGIATVFLVASHTHHGPVLELDNWPNQKNPYTKQLQEKLVEVVLRAAKRLQPAKLGIASRQVPFNRNRHSKRDNPVVDHELLVLRVEDRAGKPLAHAVNFAAHPTLRPVKEYQFSADWPGAMAAQVEKETGAPCLFLQGAAGDLTANSQGQGPDKFGETVAATVLEMSKKCRCQSLTDPDLQVREDEFKFDMRLDLTNKAVRLLFVAAFFGDLVNFYEREYRDGVRPRMTTALLDQRIGFVGVSGEFFSGHSLHLKRRARLEHLFFLGYCNDYQQYFPTIEAAAEGGYGADPTVSPVEVGAGERMMDRALIHLYRMRGKLPSLPLDKTP